MCHLKIEEKKEKKKKRLGTPSTLHRVTAVTA